VKSLRATTPGNSCTARMTSASPMAGSARNTAASSDTADVAGAPSKRSRSVSWACVRTAASVVAAARNDSVTSLVSPSRTRTGRSTGAYPTRRARSTAVPRGTRVKAKRPVLSVSTTCGMPSTDTVTRGSGARVESSRTTPRIPMRVAGCADWATASAAIASAASASVDIAVTPASRTCVHRRTEASMATGRGAPIIRAGQALVSEYATSACVEPERVVRCVGQYRCSLSHASGGEDRHGCVRGALSRRALRYGVDARDRCGDHSSRFGARDDGRARLHHHTDPRIIMNRFSNQPFRGGSVVSRRR
jgi:hypothetical protein